MISDHLERSSFEEMSEVFHSPYNCKLLQLCCTIISDCSSIGSACITDDSLPVDLLPFSVVLPSDWEILCQDSTKSIPACISVQLEGSLEGGARQDRG